MQNQQCELSASTRYRFSHCNRNNQLQQYLAFKSQYENRLEAKKIQQLKSIYPHGILGRNQNNQIVVMDRVGNIKASQLNKIADDDTFLGYLFQRLIFLSQNVLAQKEQIIWIIDLAGKIMQLASKRSYAVLQKFIKQAHKYFPGILYKLYFINTPMLFDTIWNKISESVDEHTQVKIVHLNDDIEQLTVEVGQALLPQYLGGLQSQQILHKADAVEKKDKKKFKRDSEQQSSNQQQQIDINSLKMALSGLKLGANHNHPSVAQTPLNTEADDK